MTFRQGSIVRRLGATVSRRCLGTVTQVETAKRVAALTFDHGPHPQFTPQLLEILDANDARATFFMVGRAASQMRGIVRQVADGGHAIGNHSWDHSSFPFIGLAERFRQIRLCTDALRPYGSTLFRFPWGQHDVACRLAPFMLRQTVVGWSVDPRDYATSSVDVIRSRLTNGVMPGSIVLLHDSIYHSSNTDRRPMLEALDSALRHLNDFQFVTLPELMRYGRPRKINAYWRPAFPPLSARNAVTGMATAVTGRRRGSDPLERDGRR